MKQNKYVTFFLLFIVAYLLSNEIKEGLSNLLPSHYGQLERKDNIHGSTPLFYR